MSPHPTDPPAPSRRRRRRLAWAVLALAAVAVAFLALRGPLESRVRRALERGVASAGGSLRFDEFHFDPLRLTLEFRELRLELRAPPARPLSIRVREGRTRLAWSGLPALAAGRVHLAEARFVEPSIEIDGEFFRRRAAGPATRPLDLRIDLLELSAGRVRFDDREHQLDLRASDVGLRAGWHAASRSLSGGMHARIELVRPPVVRPLTLAVQGGFRLKRHDVELLEVEASGDGLELTGEATVTLTGPATAVGRGEIRADLGRLGAFLDAGFPRVAGRVAGPFSFETGPDPFRFRGQLRGEDVHFGRLAADSVETGVHLTPEHLELLDLRARAFDGDVTGSVEVAWAGPTRFDARLEAARVDLRRLLDWIGPALPFGARVEGSLALSGEADDLASWDGQGTFRARPRDAGGVGLAADGTFELAGGSWRARSEGAETGSARLDCTLGGDLLADEPTGRVELTGETHDAARTQAAALRVLASLGVATPELVRLPLAGSGSLRASVDYGPETRTVLGFDLREGAFGGQEFDRARASVTVDPERVSFSDVALARGEQSLHASGSLAPEPFELLSLDLEAEALDPAWALRLAGAPADRAAALAGRLAGRLTVAGPGGWGSGSLRLEEAAWSGQPLGTVRLELGIDPTAVSVDRWTVGGGAIEAEGGAAWDLQTGSGHVQVERSAVELGRLETIAGRGIPVEGLAAFEGTIGISSEAEPSGELAVRLDGLRVATQELGQGSGRLWLDPEQARVSLSGSGGGSWSADARLGWSAELPLDGQVAVDGAVLLLGAGDGPLASARVRGSGSVRGELARPETLVVDGTLEDVEIDLGAARVRLSEPARLRFAEGQLTARPIRVAGAGTELGGSLTWDAERDRIELVAEGDLDLGLVAARFPDLRAQGPVAVSLRVEGPLAAPRWSGSLRASDGRVRWLRFPQSLEHVAFEVALGPQGAQIITLESRVGSGELSASGTVELAGLSPGAVRGTIHVANVRLSAPEGFRGVYEADLRLEAETETSVLAGRVRLLRGVYDKKFGLGELLGRGSRDYAVSALSGMPDSLLLDVDFVADGNVWVRNELAEFETALELHVGGTARRPEVTGRVWVLPGGEIVFRGVKYRIESGSVELVDLQRLDPFISLRARTQVRDYAIFLRVEGTLDRFEYELTSDPALATQDIISLLTSGRTLEEINAGGGGGNDFTGDLAANYFAGALTQPFERTLKRVLGVERVQINPLLVRNEADPTTRITLGEEITDDLLVVFSTDVGQTERQLYSIEWQVVPSLQLVAERDTLGGIGGDVRYSTRFWGPAGAPASASAPSAQSPGHAPPIAEGPAVSTVEIRGVGDTERERLRGRLPLRPGAPFSRSAMFAGAEAIRAYYVAAGRIEADVSASSRVTEDGTAVEYAVEPGPPVEVELTGVSNKERRRLRESLRELWVESLFNEDLYQDSAELIRDRFHERGHYAVDVAYHSELHDGQRRVIFEIDRGKPVRVERLTLEGVLGLPESRVRGQILTRPGSLIARRLLVPSVLETDVAAVRGLYLDEGYLDVAIEPPRIRLGASGESATVEIRIDEGPRYTVGRLDLPEGLPVPAARLRAWSGLGEGEVYSEARLLKAESGIRAGLDELGYPDARVRGHVERAEARVDVGFEIEPGGQKRLAEVRIRGNRLTRDKIIRRELALEPGDPISRDRLLESQHDLYRLGLFRSVRLHYEPLDESQPAEQRLDVEVEEAKPMSAGVGAGWDSEAGPRGGFSVGHDNLGGLNRSLRMQTRFSGIERRVQLTAREPRLFTARLPTLINLSWEDREESAFTIERGVAALRVDRRLNARWAGWTRYGFQRVDISDVEDPGEVQSEKLESVQLADVGLALVRDTRDDPFLPTRGTSLAGEVRVFARPLGSERSFVKSTLAGSLTHTLPRERVSATGLRIGVARPVAGEQVVPISESFFAGGDSTLRGFERDEVGAPTGGEALFLFNQELRFPLWRALRGVVFYDAGNVFDQISDLDVSDLRHVLGAGLRVETPIGPIRLEYGRKLDRKPEESKGEWFLAIGSAF